ncbi:MAG: hypothetical protein AAF281_09660, partial [Pseudomonadota bacterium]
EIGCPEPTRAARTVRVQPTAPLQASTVNTGTTAKLDEILDQDRIRILDEEALPGVALDPDCAPRVVRAAADQLGDGTVLAPVTISSARDTRPAADRVGPTPVTPARVGLTTLANVPEPVIAIGTPEILADPQAANTQGRVRVALHAGAGADLGLRPVRIALPNTVAGKRTAPAPLVTLASASPQLWAGSGAEATARVALIRTPPAAQPRLDRSIARDEIATQILRSGR